MKWMKAAVVGALGSLVMFAILFTGIHVTGVAPFNQPPSAAFLTKLGLNAGPLPLVMHFGYGAFWAVVLLAWKGDEASTGTGIGLALGLWAFMMLVLSPIIGWGVFGTGGAQLPPDHPLYLGSPVKYVGLTLVLHLIYGSIIGYGTAAWAAAPSSDDATQGSLQQATS
jgi:hypothetical protein